MRIVALAIASLLLLATPSHAEQTGGSCGEESSDPDSHGKPKDNETAPENETKSHGNKTADNEGEAPSESECASASSAVHSGGGGSLPTGDGCQLVTAGTTTGFPFVDAQVDPSCANFDPGAPV